MFKKGDVVKVCGYVGEVISVSDTEIEVLFGGDALHYCVEKYPINFDEIELLEEVRGGLM